MSEIKKREFVFDEKENYTPLEVKAILSQHSNFVSNSTAKEAEELKAQLAKLEESNSNYAKAERTRTIRKLAKEIDADNFEKILKYTSIADDADEEAIKKSMAETKADFVSAAPAVTTNTKTPVVKTVGEVKEPEKPTKEKKYRFVK